MQAPTKFRAGIIGAGLTFFILLQLLTKYPSFVERYYSNGLYPVITVFVSNLSGLFDFSLSEFALGFILLILLPVFLGRLVTGKMRFTRLLLNIATMAALVVTAFYLLWGLNYFRMPLTAKLNLDSVPLKIDSFDSTFVAVVQEANESNSAYSLKELDEINDLIEVAYDDVMSDLQLTRIRGTKVIKSMLFNWFLNKTTTSGWFSPFFHEVHFNNELLIVELPFVVAHEKAHRLGYTSEAEANFLAYLVCLNADDPLLRYSGHFNALAYFLQSVRGNIDKRKYFSDLINEGVKLDLLAVRERWKSHIGAVSRMSGKSYDLYLRANQIEEGRRNYSRVIDLIVKYRRQKELEEQPEE